MNVNINEKYKIENKTLGTYRMLGDIMSILQDLIPEAIPSQKRHMNTGLILNGYGATGI
jgi:hypothetical protein